MQLPLDKGVGGIFAERQEGFQQSFKANYNQKNKPDLKKSGLFFTLSKLRYPFDFLKVRLSLFKKCITPFLGFFGHVSQACCFSSKDLLAHHPIVS